MESLISVFIILFLIGAISFLKPSKKMKALSQIRMLAAKEGFKIGSTNELRKKFNEHFYRFQGNEYFFECGRYRAGAGLRLNYLGTLCFEKVLLF